VEVADERVVVGLGAVGVPATRRNLARYCLLDPQARERVTDWEQVAAETVAILRLEAGRHPHDRRLADSVSTSRARRLEASTSARRPRTRAGT
jgi:hypothetical protein